MPAPVIILVDPQMGENIGAAARAMLNCGLSELRLVRPRDGWPNERAEAMSAGALSVMPPVRVFDTVENAVADCHWVYATTARPRDMAKPVMTAREAAQDIRTRAEHSHRTAILFGGERAGLTNDDVALAHTIITIPLNPEFSSLNLGQCVLLCGYEWYQAQPRPEALSHVPATHKEFNAFFKRLESELDAHGFFRSPEMKPTVSRNVRTMLSRANPSDQEINTFHGILSALTSRKG
ncbi:MAG: RNA methyltransferase [Alphaproteobacteria bacterium]|nr:RNA methyltransferase [Alphaproteobacteria bacterium]